MMHKTLKFVSSNGEIRNAGNFGVETYLKMATWRTKASLRRILRTRAVRMGVEGTDCHLAGVEA
jgi:hypothetical protein